MKKADWLLWRSVDVAILFAVLGLVALIVIQVSSRVVDASVPWTEELSRFLFIWTVWLGLAASFRAGAHPSLDMLALAAPPKIRVVLGLVRVAATVILFAAVTWNGFWLLRQQIAFGELSPILQVGMWIATLPLVLGSGLSILGTVTESIAGEVQNHGFEDAVAGAEDHLT